MKRLVVVLVFFPMLAWAQNTTAPATASTTVQMNTTFGSPCPYPDSALQAGKTGVTTLHFRVSDGGRIDDVTIAGGSGNAELNAAGVQCLSQWRVAPTDKRFSTGIGVYPATIVWTIPAPNSSTPTAPPAGIFSVGIAHNCQAWYPPREFKEKVSGIVGLEFVITTDGNVKDAKVSQTSGNDELDSAALRCVATWHYTPASQNNKPVEAPWRAIVKFGAD